VSFAPSFKNQKLLSRIKSMDQMSLQKYILPKQNYEKRLNYSTDVKRSNDGNLQLNSDQHDLIVNRSIQIDKRINFGKYLSQDRQAKAAENILHKGDYLRHSKEVAKEYIKSKEDSLKQQGLTQTKKALSLQAQERSTFDRKLREHKRKKQIGNGYLLELKKSQEAIRLQQESTMQQKIDFLTSNN
jgi:hypothetical protein